MDKLAFIADSRGADCICAFLKGTSQTHEQYTATCALLIPPLTDTLLLLHGGECTENRKDAAMLLDTLAQPVLLAPEPNTAVAAAGKDIGIYMEERMSLRAQRELWSALVRLSGEEGSSPVPQVQVLRLTNRYLHCAAKKLQRASDPVCRSLAQMIVMNCQSEANDASCRHHREVDDDESLATIKRDAAFKEAMKQLTFSRMIPMLSSTLLAVLSDNDDASQEQRVLLSFTRATTTAATIPPAETLLRNKRGAVADAQANEESPANKNKRARVEEQRTEGAMQTEDTRNVVMQDSQAAAELSPEMEEKAVKLAKQLAQLASSDAHASRAAMDEIAKATVQLIQETINATNTTQQATETLFAKLCATLQLAKSSDEALFQVTTLFNTLLAAGSALIESNWSSRYASVFLETSVFPKILAASSVISRVLLQTALLFAQRYTSALVESLLIPLLTANGIGSAQGEAITRILRNGVPLEQLDGFLSKSFQQIYEKQQSSNGTNSETAESTGESKHFFTNDAALMVLQNVLTMKATLSDTTIGRFVACCEAAQEKRDAQEVQKSLKFATLVFTMVSKYADQCTVHADALEGIGKSLTSLMAKSTMRTILKLKSNSAASR